jgi:hypothetical protein
MLRIPCPKCGEISYTPNVEGFYPCPRCADFFSGKFGLDRRRELRRLERIRLRIYHQGRNYRGETFDVSMTGFGVEMLGSPQFSIHEVLTIDRKRYGISRAKVVWIKKDNQKARFGIETVN